MPCTGTFIPHETMAAIANDELLCAYIENFIENGELIISLPEIEVLVKQLFGSHLKLVFIDAQTNEQTEEKPTYYLIQVEHHSFFHSKEIH